MMIHTIALLIRKSSFPNNDIKKLWILNRFSIIKGDYILKNNHLSHGH